MKIIELDLTGSNTLEALHEKIRIAFGFPEWYGKNWNAFHDLLRTECDADKVIIRGENTLPKSFEKDLTVMHRILDLKTDFNKKHNLNDFSYETV